jgi:ACS family hexuronate transporter-like MFS transporter
MFGSTVLSYLDRQSVSLLGPYLKTEFGLNNAGYGWVLAAFSLSYAFFQVPAGYLADRCDVRQVYAWAVGWWSLAAVAMAFSPTLGVLMGLRALLGLGESFNWPCALRATSAVLPAADRSLGNGIFNSGAAVGAVLGPLIVPRLATWYGWRPTFVIVGSLGAIWVFAWLWMVRGSKGELLAGRGKGSVATKDQLEASSILDELNSRRVRKSHLSLWLAFGSVLVVSLVVAASFLKFGERSIWWALACFMLGLLLACRVLSLRSLQGLDWAEALGEIVRLRRFWVLAVVSISINVCWNFLINWLPTYLKEDRGMSYLNSTFWTALPFLAADFGNLGGGALTGRLTGRGLSPSASRFRVMCGCSLLIGPGVLVGRVESNGLVIGLLVMMAFGTAAFMANYFACCQEVSSRHTGLVVGVLAGFLPFAGSVKDATGSFGPIFLMVGLLPFVGIGALLVGWGSDVTSSPEGFRSASGGSLR